MALQLPHPETAPQAIRCLANAIRQGVPYFRRREDGEYREEVLAALRRDYEQAPPDEVVHPIHRTGNALLNGPGGTYFASTSTWHSNDGYGYNKIAVRARRIHGVLFPGLPNLPDSWSARFYARVEWPPEPLPEGQHRHELFLDVSRGPRRLRIPIHDASQPWTGRKFKARFLNSALGPVLPYDGYIVFASRLGGVTLACWLTQYLARRRFLTLKEEDEAIKTFVLRGPPDVQRARGEAYQRLCRRFVQPLAGYPSFATYFSKATRGILLEQRAHDSEPVFPMQSEDLVSLRLLRFREPKLHRALLDRIDRGLVVPVTVDGHLLVARCDADRVEREREANAAIKTKSPFTREQRLAWVGRLIRKGLSEATARRKLARWINVQSLSESEINASVSADRLVRIPPSA